MARTLEEIKVDEPALETFEVLVSQASPHEEVIQEAVQPLTELLDQIEQLEQRVLGGVPGLKIFEERLEVLTKIRDAISDIPKELKKQKGAAKVFEKLYEAMTSLTNHIPSPDELTFTEQNRDYFAQIQKHLDEVPEHYKNVKLPNALLAARKYVNDNIALVRGLIGDLDIDEQLDNDDLQPINDFYKKYNDVLRACNAIIKLAKEKEEALKAEIEKQQELYGLIKEKKGTITIDKDKEKARRDELIEERSEAISQKALDLLSGIFDSDSDSTNIQKQIDEESSKLSDASTEYEQEVNKLFREVEEQIIAEREQKAQEDGELPEDYFEVKDAITRVEYRITVLSTVFRKAVHYALQLEELDGELMKLPELPLDEKSDMSTIYSELIGVTFPDAKRILDGISGLGAAVSNMKASDLLEEMSVLDEMEVKPFGGDDTPDESGASTPASEGAADEETDKSTPEEDTDVSSEDATDVSADKSPDAEEATSSDDPAKTDESTPIEETDASGEATDDAAEEIGEKDDEEGEEGEGPKKPDTGA